MWRAVFIPGICINSRSKTSNPLKQKTTALKYLTPQLYANAPRLIRRMDADIFICAQDWDTGWEKNFSVSTPQIKNTSATETVTLPAGEIDTDQDQSDARSKQLPVGESIRSLARIDRTRLGQQLGNNCKGGSPWPPVT